MITKKYNRALQIFFVVTLILVQNIALCQTIVGGFIGPLRFWSNLQEDGWSTEVTGRAEKVFKYENIEISPTFAYSNEDGSMVFGGLTVFKDGFTASSEYISTNFSKSLESWGMKSSDFKKSSGKSELGLEYVVFRAVAKGDGLTFSKGGARATVGTWVYIPIQYRDAKGYGSALISIFYRGLNIKNSNGEIFLNKILSSLKPLSNVEILSEQQYKTKFAQSSAQQLVPPKSQPLTSQISAKPCYEVTVKKTEEYKTLAGKLRIACDPKSGWTHKVGDVRSDYTPTKMFLNDVLVMEGLSIGGAVLAKKSDGFEYWIISTWEGGNACEPWALLAAGPSGHRLYADDFHKCEGWKRRIGELTFAGLSVRDDAPSIDSACQPYLNVVPSKIKVRNAKLNSGFYRMGLEVSEELVPDRYRRRLVLPFSCHINDYDGVIIIYGAEKTGRGFPVYITQDEYQSAIHESAIN